MAAPTLAPEPIFMQPAMTEVEERVVSVGTSERPPPEAEENRLARPLSWPDADIVLISSDGVKFHVHKSILSLSSSFFGTMFELPQPGGEQPSRVRRWSPLRKRSRGDSAERTGDAAPSEIEMPEDSHTLTVLLKAIYPDSCPSFSVGLDLTNKAAQAAQKYEMAGVLEFLSQRLQDPCNAQDAPLRAFAITVRHGWKEAVQVTGELASAQPLVAPYPKELEDISAAQFCELLEYRRKRCEELFDGIIHSALTEAGRSADRSQSWGAAYTSSPTSNIADILVNLNSSCSRCIRNPFSSLAGYPTNGPLWLIDHLHRTKEAYVQYTDSSSVMLPNLLVQTLTMISTGVNSGCNCSRTAPINLIRLQQQIAATLKAVEEKVTLEL